MGGVENCIFVSKGIKSCVMDYSFLARDQRMWLTF
jgi:hypothetical protein